MFENRTLLEALWDASVFLGILSVAIFSGLVVVRIFTEHNKLRYLDRYQELEAMLLVHMTTPLKNLSKTFVKSAYDAEILCDIAQQLLQSLQSDSWGGLSSFINETGLEKNILKDASGGNLKKQISSIRLMGYLRGNKVFSRIIHEKLSSSEDSRIIYACADALANHGNIESFPEVVKAFNRCEDISPLIIYDIIDRFDADKNFRQLEEVIHSELYRLNVRIACIYCLAAVKNERGIGLLEKLYNHANPRISSASYNAMARMDMEIPYHIIQYGAKSKNWRIRLHTVNCIRHSSHLPVEEILILLSDDNWIISSKAAEILLSFGDMGVRILKTIAGQKSVVGKRASLFLNEYEESYVA